MRAAFLALFSVSRPLGRCETLAMAAAFLAACRISPCLGSPPDGCCVPCSPLGLTPCACLSPRDGCCVPCSPLEKRAYPHSPDSPRDGCCVPCSPLGLSLPRTKGVPNPVHQLVGQEAVICCISGWHALKGDPLPPNWSLATLRSRPGGRASLGQGGRIPLCTPPI